MTETAVATRVGMRTTSGLGLALALVSAAAFSLSGPLARSLIDNGWTPGAVVGIRIAGASLLLLPVLVTVLVRTGVPTGRQALRVVAYGCIAVAGAQFCFFNAVERLSVGVALLLEYLAPVLLIFWHWWRSGVRPRRAVLLGAALALVGMVGVLDVVSGIRLDLIGVGWGLLAALCLCGYFLLSDDTGEATVHPLIMTSGGLLVGGLMIIAGAVSGVLPIAGNTLPATLAGVSVPWWFPLLGLIVLAGAFGYLVGLLAVRRLGSATASFVSLTEVIFAVVFAAVLVTQTPTLGQAIGGLLVLSGIAIVQRGGR